jgi:hypothetical protein
MRAGVVGVVVALAFVGVLSMKLRETQGIRNNNPLNIRENEANKWAGAIGAAGGFVQFLTPVYGIRAAAKLLKNYREKYGIDTIAGIVAKWAPPSENETDSYIKSVSQKTNIEQDAVLSDWEYVNVIEAMIYHENGKQPYTQETIKAGFNMGFYS